MISRKRKVLLIGGTGTISTAVTQRIAKSEDWEVYILNRGQRKADIPENVKVIKCDMSNEEEAAKILKDMTWDCVGNFIGFTPDQVERDIRLFAGKTKQYIYISSAACYNTPPTRPFMTESMMLKNNGWGYAVDKIACEEVLTKAFREKNFPVTIVRPAHTYGEKFIPFCLESPRGSWPVMKRMLEGKQVIVPGDGSSLWAITFNEDFAKGYVGLIGNPHAIGETVHIMTDEILTWDQMAEAVADALGVEYKPYYIPTDVIAALAPEMSEGLNGDKRHSVIYDISKIKKLVPDYCPNITWRTGVQRALSVIMNDESLRPEDPAFDLWCDQMIEIYDKALETAKKTCVFPK